jgi:hypothetical protein
MAGPQANSKKIRMNLALKPTRTPCRAIASQRQAWLDKWPFQC